MKYLKYSISAGKGDVVEVNIDKAANVMLMDSTNFSRYSVGHSHTYYGGYQNTSPVHIRVPYQGQWNVVIDLGGGAGSVRASVQIIRPF